MHPCLHGERCQLQHRIWFSDTPTQKRWYSCPWYVASICTLLSAQLKLLTHLQKLIGFWHFLAFLADAWLPRNAAALVPCKFVRAHMTTRSSAGVTVPGLTSAP